MTRLGYDRYGAQGGDWGATVTTSLAQTGHRPDDLTPGAPPPGPEDPGGDVGCKMGRLRR